ncbi:MAG: rRNA maturation RNase YbeY [Armatimonadetes bacterium]|nr:rRNA maturation RNase YbeY [Armatimonadota bacterium]
MTPETETLIRNEQPLPLNLSRIRQAVENTLCHEGFLHPCEVSLLFTDDPGIRLLNREWRGLDQPTDVLSFPQETKPSVPGRPTLLGDIVISAETAWRQAEAAGWSLEDEIDHLTVHGMLHLLGYDDEAEAGAEEMEARERAVRDPGARA